VLVCAPVVIVSRYLFIVRLFKCSCVLYYTTFAAFVNLEAHLSAVDCVSAVVSPGPVPVSNCGSVRSSHTPSGPMRPVVRGGSSGKRPIRVCHGVHSSQACAVLCPQRWPQSCPVVSASAQASVSWSLSLSRSAHGSHMCQWWLWAWCCSIHARSLSVRGGGRCESRM